MGRIGSLVNLSSESELSGDHDQKVHDFGRKLAMHIASQRPKYLTIDSIPKEDISSEVEEIHKRMTPETPSGDMEKLVNRSTIAISSKLAVLPTFRSGLKDLYSRTVLLEQAHVLEGNGKESVRTLLDSLSSTVGSKISLESFYHLEVGRS